MKSRIKNEVTNDKTHSDVLGLFLAPKGSVGLAGKTIDGADIIVQANRALFLFTTHGSPETEKKGQSKRKES